MKNLIKLGTLLVILILNSGFYGLNFFQKKSNAPVPFKVVRTLTDGSAPNIANSTSTHAYFTTNFSNSTWVTDGTTVGTQAMTTWLPNLPTDFELVGESLGLVYYKTYDTQEVWRSDNTVAGTYAITAPAIVNGFKEFRTVTFGGQSYTFAIALDQNYSDVIFQTDGTMAGTAISAVPADTTVITWGMTPNGPVVLLNNNSSGDLELALYDLTTKTLGASYTTLPGYMYYGFLSNAPSNLDKFYFSLHLWGGCDRMFVTDGTAAGTYNLSSVQYCKLRYAGTAPDGSQVFLAMPGFNKWEFYKTKGTSTSDWTLLVQTPYDDQTSTWGVDFNFTVNNNIVVRFYEANKGHLAASCPIWISDGTGAGTVLYSNSIAIHDPTNASLNGSNFSSFIFNNKIIFQGYTAGLGEGLWQTDIVSGPPSAVITGIRFSADAYYPSYFARSTPGYFSFVAYEAATGYEIYRSDATPGGSYLLKDINVGASNGLDAVAAWGQAVGNNVVFAANNNTNGTELWVTDGTSVGTVPLAFLNQNPGASWLTDFQVIGGSFYFSARDNTHGYEPWVSDGTSTGTHLLIDTVAGDSAPFRISYGESSSGAVVASYVQATEQADFWLTDGTTPGTTKYYTGYLYSDFTSSNGNIYFSGYDATNGQQLWKTDGTLPNTSLVKALKVGSVFDYSINWIHPFNNSVVFAPNRGIPGNPWISDGTAAGTVELIHLVNGNWDTSYPSGAIQLGAGQMIFAAYDASFHQALYSTDGTPAGTALLKDVNPGAGPGIYLFAEASNRAIFTADDGINGYELWSTDGTPGGTQIIKDISNGAAATDFDEEDFVSDGTYVYFMAQPSGQDWQLWKTDGTSGGTSLIYTFPAGSSPYNTKMITAGPYIFFTACTVAQGCELWRSDKTGAGTRLYWDLNPGAGSSEPTALLYFNNTIYFIGNYLGSSRAIWSTGINSH